MNLVNKWQPIGLFRVLLCLFCVWAGLSSPGYAKQRTDSIITQLTSEQTVVGYLRQNHRLPDYYVTKKQARAQGWDARAGNLCQVLPGRLT